MASTDDGAAVAPTRRAATARRRSSRTASRRSSRCASAILGGVLLAIFAALFLRLWALQVLAGQKYVEPGAGELVPHAARAGAARAHPRPQRRPARHEPPATAIQLWPSDLPKVYNDRYAELARLARVSRVPLYEIARGIKARLQSGDLVTPVTVRDSASNLMVNYLARARLRVPRRRDRPRRTSATTRTRISPRRCSATSARSRRRS